MNKNVSVPAQVMEATVDVSQHNSSVMTRDAQIEGTPTRSKKDCFTDWLFYQEPTSKPGLNQPNLVQTTASLSYEKNVDNTSL